MRSEAASGGFFHSDLWNEEYARIQLRTVSEMMAGQGFDMPPRRPMYQAAERVRPPEGEQGTMDGLERA